MFLSSMRYSYIGRLRQNCMSSIKHGGQRWPWMTSEGHLGPRSSVQCSITFTTYQVYTRSRSSNFISFHLSFNKITDKTLFHNE